MKFKSIISHFCLVAVFCSFFTVVHAREISRDELKDKVSDFIAETIANQANVELNQQIQTVESSGFNYLRLNFKEIKGYRCDIRRDPWKVIDSACDYKIKLNLLYRKDGYLVREIETIISVETERKDQFGEIKEISLNEILPLVIPKDKIRLQGKYQPTGKREVTGIYQVYEFFRYSNSITLTPEQENYILLLEKDGFVCLRSKCSKKVSASELPAEDYILKSLKYSYVISALNLNFDSSDDGPPHKSDQTVRIFEKDQEINYAELQCAYGKPIEYKYEGGKPSIMTLKCLGRGGFTFSFAFENPEAIAQMVNFEMIKKEEVGLGIIKSYTINVNYELQMVK
jgi:hypothetical protein